MVSTRRSKAKAADDDDGTEIVTPQTPIGDENHDETSILHPEEADSNDSNVFERVEDVSESTRVRGRRTRSGSRTGRRDSEELRATTQMKCATAEMSVPQEEDKQKDSDMIESSITVDHEDAVQGDDATRDKRDNPGDVRFSNSGARSIGHSKAVGNGLTELIPGYVAPLKLEASSLNRYRPRGGIAELRRQAVRSDASTSKFVVDTAEPGAEAMKRSSNGFLPTKYASLYSSFKTGTKRAPDLSAGKGWFGMVPTPMTDEVKTDLAVIRNRNYLDPKRFYKSADNNKNKVLQVGTVIEGASEFYSSRLTKKQRRSNLTEEIMADPAVAGYTTNKYRTMQRTKTEHYRKANKKKNPRKARRGF